MKSVEKELHYGIWPKIVYFLLFVNSGYSNYCPLSTEAVDFSLNDARIRHARRRCLAQFPQAEVVNYTDTSETQCFLHCFLYKVGLMDLCTRGLDSNKFIDIWEQIEVATKMDICSERYDFDEALSGSCSDTYRKLMELRTTCVQIFEYAFNNNSAGSMNNFENSKRIGQSATEFCDASESDNFVSSENSQSKDVSLLTEYKNKLICILENIHYLDAYGRVDAFEINLSYAEAQADSPESRSKIRICCQRANAKFQPGFLGNVVLELQTCLKAQSAVFNKVFKRRDEISRQY